MGQIYFLKNNWGQSNNSNFKTIGNVTLTPITQIMRLVEIKRISLCILLLLLFGCYGGNAPISSHVVNNIVDVRIGPYKLEVPKKNAILYEQTFPWLRSISHADTDANSITLVFYNQDIKKQIPNYRIPKMYNGDNREYIIVGIDYLDNEQINNAIHSGSQSSVDFWYGIGKYKNRVIAPLKGTQWYRVYNDSKYKTSWEVIDTFPDKKDVIKKKNPILRIAVCSKSSFNDENQCFSYLVNKHRNLVYEIHNIEANLIVRDKITDYINNKLENWMKTK